MQEKETFSMKKRVFARDIPTLSREMGRIKQEGTTQSRGNEKNLS
jgi:hypothetical protein